VSVEQSDTIDIVGIQRETGHVVLTISDHLDWADTVAHQTILQKKLNAYLAFVESGEIVQSYPDAKNRQVAFRVVFRFPPDDAGRAFIARARAVIESAGFTLRDFSPGANSRRRVPDGVRRTQARGRDTTFACLLLTWVEPK